MMNTTALKPATTPIPVQLSENEFTAFILPHLSMPKRGPKCKLGYHRVFNLILWGLYTGMQWKCLPVPTEAHGKPAIHSTPPSTEPWRNEPMMGRSGKRSWPAWRILPPRSNSTSACCMATGPTPWPKKGDGLGYSGYKHQKGEKVMAIIDTNGSVVAPLPVAPVN